MEKEIVDFVTVLGKRSLFLQAACVYKIVEEIFPMWSERCSGNPAALSASNEFYVALGSSLESGNLNASLPNSLEKLQQHMVEDLSEDPDKSSGMAGWALFDVGLVILDLCEDVHDDILATSIQYGARAACGIDTVPINVFENFESDELAYLLNWKRQCTFEFEELGGFDRG